MAVQPISALWKSGRTQKCTAILNASANRDVTTAKVVAVIRTLRDLWLHNRFFRYSRRKLPLVTVLVLETETVL